MSYIGPLTFCSLTLKVFDTLSLFSLLMLLFQVHVLTPCKAMAEAEEKLMSILINERF